MTWWSNPFRICSSFKTKKDFRCGAMGCGKIIKSGEAYIEATIGGQRQIFCQRICLEATICRLSSQHEGDLNVELKKQP